MPATAVGLTLHTFVDALQTARDWLLEPDHADALAAAEGDLDALPELRDLLEQAEMDFALKAERVALVALDRGRTAKAIDDEITRLQKMKRAAANSEAWLKRYLLFAFTKANVKKIDGTLAKPRVQANPVAIRVELLPEALKELHGAGNGFVEEYIPPSIPSYSVNTKAVLEAYKMALELVGPCPELGSADYHEARPAWEQAIAEKLVELGVPSGIRIERGAHVRIG